MVFICPNAKCGNQKALKQGEICSQCGATAQNFGFRESLKMSTQKEQFKKSSVRIENQDTQSLPKAVTTSQASSPNPPTETTSSPALSNLAPKTNDENSQPYQGKKWEYKLEMALAFGGKFMVGNLDKLGEEGWEAVGVTFDSAHSLTYVLLKREKR